MPSASECRAACPSLAEPRSAWLRAGSTWIQMHPVLLVHPAILIHPDHPCGHRRPSRPSAHAPASRETAQSLLFAFNSTGSALDQFATRTDILRPVRRPRRARPRGCWLAGPRRGRGGAEAGPRRGRRPVSGQACERCAAGWRVYWLSPNSDFRIDSVWIRWYGTDLGTSTPAATAIHATAHMHMHMHM